VTNGQKDLWGKGRPSLRPLSLLLRGGRTAFPETEIFGFGYSCAPLCLLISRSPVELARRKLEQIHKWAQKLS